MILYTDLHADDSGAWLIALRAIGDAAIKSKDKRVANLGDTFDVRGTVRASILDALYKEWKRWRDAGVHQYIIPGNHDQEDRGGAIHPLRVFREFGWDVFDEPTLKDGIWFVPYMPVEEACKFFEKTPFTPGYLCFTHMGFRGAKRNDYNVDEDGVPVSLVDGLQVYCGHYHLRSKLGNINYIGNTHQRDFGEKGQEKGYYNLTNGKHIPILGTPRFYDAEVEFVAGKPQITAPKGVLATDRVRARVVGSSEEVASIQKDFLEKSLGCAVKVEREIIAKAHSRLNIKGKEVNDVESLMQKYVDFVHTPLDKARLMEVGRGLVHAKS